MKRVAISILMLVFIADAALAGEAVITIHSGERRSVDLPEAVARDLGEDSHHWRWMELRPGLFCTIQIGRTGRMTEIYYEGAGCEIHILACARAIAYPVAYEAWIREWDEWKAVSVDEAQQWLIRGGRRRS